MENTNKSNLIAIDIVRAFASLGVFSYHQQIGNLLVRYTHLSFFGYFDFFGSTYAVPLFFLISGYCIHLSNLKYIKSQSALPLGTYYKRRFLRIFPPYLAAVIFSIAVIYFTGYSAMPDYKDIFVHLFCLQGFTVPYFNTINLVLWTITIEIAFYIIYPIFYYLRLKYGLNKALLAVFLVSLLFITYFTFQKNIPHSQFYFVGNIWFAWCCGAFIADKLYFNPAYFNTVFYKIIYALIFIAFVVLFVLNIKLLAIVTYQVNIIVWSGPLIFILSKEKWLSKRKSIFLNILVYIGLSSYSLYLLHEPLIALKNYIVHEFLPAKFQIIGFILGVFIIPLIAWFNYCYVEKPFMSKKSAIKK